MIEQTGSAVLAGGRSSRMGTDKALMPLVAGGPLMIEVVVARLEEAGLDAPLLVTNNPDAYSFLGLATARDDLPGAGPLGGIFTALSRAQQGRVLVVACDMPLLSPPLLRYMAQLPDDSDAVIPRWRDDEGRERVEPLHAIYSRRCLGPLREQIEAGHLKAGDFASRIAARFLSGKEMRSYDPQLRSFLNVNTPEEWAAIRREL